MNHYLVCTPKREDFDENRELLKAEFNALWVPARKCWIVEEDELGSVNEIAIVRGDFESDDDPKTMRQELLLNAIDRCADFKGWA